MLTEAQKKALAYNKSLCMTASAGTGKTSTLVNRYLHLIEDSGCKPSEILALTFTDKAAAEMKDRLLKEIYKREEPFWNEIKDEMIWARVSTFHSFCWGLIKEFSMESGIDPSFSVLDDITLTKIMNEGIQKLFMRKEHDDIRQCTAYCLVAWGEYQTRTYLETLYRKRHIARSFFASFESDPGGVIADWQAYLESIRQQLIDSLRTDEDFMAALRSLSEFAADYCGGGDAATRYLDQIAPYLDAVLSASSTDEVCRALAALATTKGGKANMGSKKVFGGHLEDLRKAYTTMSVTVKALPENILTIDLDPGSPAMKVTLDLIRALHTAYSSFERYVEQEKRKMGMIDFTDMIDIAYRMIQVYPSIGRILNMRYRFLMVDEFQDTDPVQNGIIMKILSFGEENSKKLFIVGDPKQSIYLFRDADVTQFTQTRDTIKRWGGEEIPLDENFRSTPAIIHFVNGLFARIFTDTGNAWDFSYERISPTKKRERDLGSVELLFSPEGKSSLVSAILEFESLAAGIRDLVQKAQKAVYWGGEGEHLDVPRAPTYRDIAILVENRTHLLYLLSALSKQEIPFRVHGGIGFYQTEEVVDLLNILSFLCNPSDDIALYGVLRSPYFGLSDADLFTVCNGRGGGFFNHIAASQDDRLQRHTSILSGWLDEVRRIPPSVLLQRIIDDTDIFLIYSALPDGIQKIANLEKICEYVRENEHRGFYTVDQLVRDLTLLVDNEEKEGEAEPGSDEDALTVMTIHGSKGLEFPIVWIPRLSETIRNNTDPIKVDYSHGVGIKIPSMDTDGELKASPPFSLIDFINRQKDFAEYKRLFYVASTRAKDHLILSGTVIDPDRIPENPDKYTSRMQMLLGHLQITVPEEGESYDFQGIPGLSLKVSRVKWKERSSFTAGQREIIVPEGTDPRLFNDLKQYSPLTERSERIFSPSEIELYLTSPVEHMDKYIRKIPDRQLLEASILERRPWTEGQILHEIFSGIPSESVLRSRGLPVKREDVEEYQALYERFRSAPLVRESDQCYFEFPFLMQLEGFRIQGYIDLLVHTRDGWAVIDYKTGKPGDEGEYDLQMALYKMAVESITGEKVKIYVYFTKNDKFIELNPDIEQFKGIISKVCSEIITIETPLN